MIVQYKTSHREPLYTLAEVEEIKNKAMQKQKVERMYFIKQKLLGVAMLAIGIIAPFLEGDATFSLIVAVPMGIGLIITKQKVMILRR